MIQNPYRKGVAAGRSDAEAFIAWREARKVDRDFSVPRPPTSGCPYSTAWAIRQWEDGRRAGMRQAGVI